MPVGRIIIFFVLLFLLLVSPMLFGVGLLNVVEAGIANLGISPKSATLVVVGAIVGSFFRIPLFSGVSVNVGGALVPLAVCAYLFSKVPVKETLIAICVMVLVCRALSRYVPGKGVLIPFFVPAMFSVGAAFVLAPEHIPEVAFVSGTLGVLLGADIARILFMMSGNRILSIGGAGVFDGILWWESLLPCLEGCNVVS